MKLAVSSRSWHSWSAIVLALPIFIVAITSILMVHGQALGFREATVKAGWLPGYGNEPAADPLTTIRTLLVTGAGEWIGTQQGLLLNSANGVQLIDAFAGQEIRGLVALGEQVFVLTQQGLWAEKAGTWKRINQGPVFGAFAAEGALYMVSPRSGVLMSHDSGDTWLKPEALAATLKAAPVPPVTGEITVARLVHDMHTGVAFLGRSGEWLWVDIIAISLALLVLTGIYMWWSAQKRKRAARARQRAAGVLAAG